MNGIILDDAMMDRLRERHPDDNAKLTAPAVTLAGIARQYRFLKELHATAIATVYLAEPVNGGAEQLAVKVIRYVPDTGGERLFDRFLQEFDLIAKIDHRNVVRIFDLGIADDHAFIAMEYLGAGRLSDRLETRVKVQMGRTRGKITIDVATMEDLERVVSLLES